MERGLEIEVMCLELIEFLHGVMGESSGGGAMVVCEILNVISATTAIIISIVFYRHSLNRERRTDTLKSLSEIRRQYFNTKTLNDKEKLKYINELEYFATGVNEKIYDIKIVKKMSGSRLIKQYESWIADFIQVRRSKFGNNLTYIEYEKMIKRLKEM